MSTHFRVVQGERNVSLAERANIMIVVEQIIANITPNISNDDTSMTIGTNSLYR